MQAYEAIRQLYTRTGNETAVLNAFKKNLIDAEDYEKILGKMPPEKTLEEVKAAKVAESKQALSDYLDANPLKSKCHGNVLATYTVTEEKQNMFSRKFSAHMALEQAGVADVMTWNAAGQPCEEWTDAECIQFIAETNAYVTPLVSYQQHLEMDILACESAEAVNAIEIDYGSLFTTKIPTGSL